MKNWLLQRSCCCCSGSEPGWLGVACGPVALNCVAALASFSGVFLIRHRYIVASMFFPIIPTYYLSPIYPLYNPNTTLTYPQSGSMSAAGHRGCIESLPRRCRGSLLNPKPQGHDYGCKVWGLGLRRMLRNLHNPRYPILWDLW